jgi:hypothetical protein
MAAGATASGASGAATAGAASSREATPQGQQSASSGMFLTTNAFKPGAMMPKEFTCDGVDSSPELDWSNPPEKTRSFALIVDDPDAPAGTWVHWVVYDMPAGTRHLPEGVPKRDEIQSGGRQGINDFHEAGYNGPCPPPGGPHRYFFKLYALDTFLNLKARSTKSGVERAMVGHVLAKSELMGRYGRE